MKLVLAFVALLALAASGQDKSKSYTFDKDEPGKAPAGWIADVTGAKKGTPPRWEVKKEDDGNVLAQLESGGGNGDYPVCLVKESSFRDGTISVRIKQISGKMDQAGGIVFRAKDKDNFYVVRANRGNSVVLFYTQEGKRFGIKSWKADVKLGEWHTLKVEIKGLVFKVLFDDKLVGEIEDTKKLFPEAGLIGVWTKADSVTYFKEFTVTPAEK